MYPKLRLLRRLVISLLFCVLIAMLSLCSTGVYATHDIGFTINKLNDRSSGAIQGVLDLSAYDLSKPAELNGEWEFYWGELIDPAKLPGIAHKKHWIVLPDYWSGEGYATYRLFIQFSNDQIGQSFALAMPNAATSYQLWIDGEAAAKNGVVGTSAEETVAQNLPQLIYFTPEQQKVELVIEVANFEHVKGGLGKQILIGQAKVMQKSERVHRAFDYMVAGSLALMAVYQLMIFYRVRRDKSTLFFSLICGLVAARSLFAGKARWIELFPDFSWDLAMRLEYIMPYLCIPAVVYYVHSLYKEEMPRWACHVSLGVSGFLAFIVVVFPVHVFTQALIVGQLFITVAVLYALYTIMIAALRKRRGAWVALVTGLILTAALLNDILYALRFVDTGDFAAVGMLFFVIAQAYIISGKYAEASREAGQLTSQLQELNNELELKVIERTSKLRANQLETVRVLSEMSAAEERNRIAQEIHSTIGHTFTSIIVQLEAGKRLIGKDEGEAVAKIENSQQLVRSGLDEIRKSIHMLGEVSKDKDKQLVPSLLKLIEDTEEQAGVKIKYEIDLTRDWPAPFNKIILYALQEGLTNGIRHGWCDEFQFSLTEVGEDRKTIRFGLQDNGRGISEEFKTALREWQFGFGLTVMKEGVEELGGTFTVLADVNHFEIVFTIQRAL